MPSLLISRNGEIVMRYYAEGFSPNRPVNIKSASKSVLSALVGIALEEGHLDSLDQTLIEFFPGILEDAPPAKQKITLRDLLLMRSGLESTSFENYGPWVTSNNWVRNALERPLVDPPG
jgi:CubicO group peptidase (beta-lactamase class C family)